MRVLQLVLAAAAVACVALALSMLLDNRGAALEALRDDATAARRAAGEVNALRARLDAIAGGAGFLDEVRARQPATVEVLAMLSERIPEDTWVERLEIDGGQLVLVLQGRNPSALVGLLQDAPGLSNPRLSGTVQADPRTGRQRFNLAATLVPIAPPAPAPAAQDAADAAATAPGEAG
jgi:general secretion pathway protein L